MSAKGDVFILDSFALLAYLGNEPGQARVRQVLEQAEAGDCTALLSVINLGEIAYIVEREQGLARAHETLAAISHYPVRVLPAEQETVLAAAHIKANHALSYADAFAVAAAQEYGGVILTGDPELAALGDVVQVEKLPP